MKYYINEAGDWQAFKLDRNQSVGNIPILLKYIHLIAFYTSNSRPITHFTKMYFNSNLSLLILLPLVPADGICPGYNYAFFNGGNKWFYTADDSCTIVATGYCDNICDCYEWGCGPAGSVDKLRVNGLWYYCRADIAPGTCGWTGNQIANRSPESCCRNDGRLNLEEGLISKRHADAIMATNALLEGHEEEYENAERHGHDLARLRRRQLSEVEKYTKREEEAAKLGDD